MDFTFTSTEEITAARVPFYEDARADFAPYYARAKPNMPELPTDNMQFAGDAEAIFLGHIETIYGVGPDGMRGSYDGSVGFLLD